MSTPNNAKKLLTSCGGRVEWGRTIEISHAMNKAEYAKKSRAIALRCRELVGPLPRNVADARVAALEEAADHLDMTWTDDAEEKHQGTEVSFVLRKMAQHLFEVSRANNKDVPTTAPAERTL